MAAKGSIRGPMFRLVLIASLSCWTCASFSRSALPAISKDRSLEKKTTNIHYLSDVHLPALSSESRPSRQFLLASHVEAAPPESSSTLLKDDKVPTETSSFEFELKNNDKSIMSKTSKNNLATLKVFICYLGSTIALAARTELVGAYTPSLIARDLGATALCTALSIIFVKSITALAARGILQPRDSRKVIHIFSAPLFIFTWPLFSSLWGARLFAASIAVLQAFRLWLASQTDIDTASDAQAKELANAVSRSGQSKEALGGPFIYVVVLFAAILTSWQDNLTGITALSAMAAGDGFADIIGRRFGTNNKWFFNKSKSIAGSLAFFFASSLCALSMASWLGYAGSLSLTFGILPLLQRILLISALCAGVELLPFGDDNWNVPISAAILATILLP